MARPSGSPCRYVVTCAASAMPGRSVHASPGRFVQPIRDTPRVSFPSSVPSEKPSGLDPAMKLSWRWDRMEHEYCTQRLPLRCERRRMVLRRSLLDVAERTGAATEVRLARGL